MIDPETFPGDSIGSAASSLLDLVRAHDADAWRRFARLYGPLVYSWARQARLQPADAANAVQDVFLAVSQHIEAFRTDRPGDSFRGWLWSIARNKIRDHFRRLRQNPSSGMAPNDLIELPEQPPDASRQARESAIWRRGVDLVRAEFETRSWQAFWRTTVDGVETARVAEELEMTPQAVRQSRYRVLRRLRVALAGLVEPQ